MNMSSNTALAPEASMAGQTFYGPCNKRERQNRSYGVTLLRSGGLGHDSLGDPGSRDLIAQGSPQCDTRNHAQLAPRISGRACQLEEFPPGEHHHLVQRLRRYGSRYAIRCGRSEEHTSELQSHSDLVCRLLLEKKNTQS